MAKTHRALDCSLCDNRIHIKCGNVSPKQYLSITATRPQTNWICQYCFQHFAFPFNNISDETFLELFPPGECDNLTEPILNVDEYEDSLEWYKSNIGSYYKHDLKIAHLNINSILNKVVEVKVMLNRNMFDILFISEAKTNNNVSSSLLAQPGFRIVRKDRKKGAGGLGAYIRADLRVVRRQKLEPTNIELICLDVKTSNNSRLIVCGCYRSPDLFPQSDFIDALSSVTEAMYMTRQELLLLDDFNMDMFENMAENRYPNRNLLDFCQRFSLVNMITKPTRVTDKS